MAFAGLAALFAARLVNGGVPFWAAIAATTVASGLLALGIGIGSLRVRGLYLAVVTFVFALTAQQYFYFLPFFSSDSPDGANVPFPTGKLWFVGFPGQRASSPSCSWCWAASGTAGWAAPSRRCVTTSPPPPPTQCRPCA
jgi:ABC-type branched-subunit amino acid transport system permease subunit